MTVTSAAHTGSVASEDFSCLFQQASKYIINNSTSKNKKNKNDSVPLKRRCIFSPFSFSSMLISSSIKAAEELALSRRFEEATEEELPPLYVVPFLLASSRSVGNCRTMLSTCTANYTITWHTIM